VRVVERRRHPRSEAKLRREQSESHGRRRDFDGPGQVAITARRGPGTRAERNRLRMTRAGGVSNANRKAPETRGAKNRMGEPTSWRGCRGRNNAEAGWPGAGKLRAVRRDWRTPKGSTQAEPQERRSPTCPHPMMRAECRRAGDAKTTCASSASRALKRAPQAEADVDDAQGWEVSVAKRQSTGSRGRTNNPQVL